MKTYPVVIEVYFPSKQGKGELFATHIANSETEYNSIAEGYIGQNAHLQERTVEWRETKGNVFKRIFKITPTWVKAVLLYVLLRVIENFLIPLILYKPSEIVK